MIKVINKYKDRTSNGVRISIMRGTPLGNRYIMSDSSQRDLVCDKYRKWLPIAYELDDKVYKAISSIRELSKNKTVLLECCCKPKRCHGDEIKAFIDWLDTNNITKGE